MFRSTVVVIVVLAAAFGIFLGVTHDPIAEANKKASAEYKREEAQRQAKINTQATELVLMPKMSMLIKPGDGPCPMMTRAGVPMEKYSEEAEKLAFKRLNPGRKMWDGEKKPYVLPDYKKFLAQQKAKKAVLAKS